MDRGRVWPDFRPEHVLYEDDDVVCVHKPAGVPSQAAQPDRPDDLVTRLRAFLAARDGGHPYLGVHQRLDRDTSGVVVFTRRPEANASIASQLEGRSVKKRYVAGVIGWDLRRRKATLDDDLARGEGGLVEVVPPGRDPRDSRDGRGRGPRGPRWKGAAHPGSAALRRETQRAVTHVTLRSQVEDRALLDLVLETGRTHQARVQLAHAGAPIAGDVLYRPRPRPSTRRGEREARSAPATSGGVRLMLHAAAIELAHPRTKRPLVVRDDLARAEMEAWLRRGDLGYGIYDDDEALRRALALAVERRWGLGRSADRDPAERRTTAFRLVNEEGDGMPGLALDVYGEHLVAQLYVSEEWERPGRRERLLDALGALGFDGTYLKLRPKQANVLVDTRRDELAPRLPVRGAPCADEIVVHEEGIPFAVRLGDGLSTGIFLDQRPNRRAVRELARGLSVANLFSYTCAFSVAAAVGGAKRTVSVDAALAALDRGRAGFALAGAPVGRSHELVADDAFSWLARTAKKGLGAGAQGPFDLVILDPPSYSSTKKRRFVAESDYDELVALACSPGVLAPGGRVLACVNHRGMSRHRFRRLVQEGARAAKREIVQLKDMPEAPDFPPAPGHDPHMKSVLLTVR